jgi:hypothetical protein
VLPGAAAEAGSPSSTTAGTVKVPSLTRAVQVKLTVVVVAAVLPYAVLEPAMATYPDGSPPAQFIVRPLARFTVVMLDWLVQTNGGGIVYATVNAPTSAPPVPENVYWPEVRVVAV